MHIGKILIEQDPALGDIVEVTLGNPQNGMIVRFLSIGAALTRWVVPDGNGQLADVVLGYDDWRDYLANDPHLGVVCGRFANRIKNAAFELNGHSYTLAVNNGPNSLHGGTIGFSRKNWIVESLAKNLTEAYVTFRMVSPDGDEGYPGNLEVRVTYTLTATSELKIHYEAVSDADTVLNLTNHTYFNLKGAGNGDILSHILWLPAEHYLELDSDCCPTGKILPVANTPFDFRSPRAIGERIYTANSQLRAGKGYDTNYCYDSAPGELKEVARVKELGSRRKLRLFTDAPGVQLYTGNWLGGISGKKQYRYSDYSGIALETQQWPAAPNFETFPSAVLTAGERFTSTTIYQFTPEF